MWKQDKKREIENYPKVDKWLSEPGEGADVLKGQKGGGRTSPAQMAAMSCRVMNHVNIPS